MPINLHEDETEDSIVSRFLRSLGVGGLIYFGSALFSAFFVKADIAKSWGENFRSALVDGRNIFAAVGTAAIDFLLRRPAKAHYPIENAPVTDVPTTANTPTDARWANKVGAREPHSAGTSYASTHAKNGVSSSDAILR